MHLFAPTKQTKLLSIEVTLLSSHDYKLLASMLPNPHATQHASVSKPYILLKVQQAVCPSCNTFVQISKLEADWLHDKALIQTLQ